MDTALLRVHQITDAVFGKNLTDVPHDPAICIRREAAVSGPDRFHRSRGSHGSWRRVHTATQAKQSVPFRQKAKVNRISGPSCIQATHLENDDSLQFSSCARPHFDPKMSFVWCLSSLAPWSLGRGSRGRGNEPAAIRRIRGVVRNARSQRLGCCWTRWPRFARHRKRRSADRGRHTASDRNCQGQCRWRLRSRYGIIDAALPDPRQMLPPVRIASASTPDPVQKDVEASALPFEVPEIESILAALPDPQEMLPPVAIASAGTPDPVQRRCRGVGAPSRSRRDRERRHRFA